MRVKQRIARLLIHEVIANIDEATHEIVLVIHWAGGRHAEGVVRRMAGAWPNPDIAATLNRLRLRTGAGNTWTASRVNSLRQRLRLVDYDETRATPRLTLNQAAD